jgi:hypothetical protein
MIRTDDDVPSNAMRLTEAYDAVLNALIANLAELDVALDDAISRENTLPFPYQLDAQEAVADLQRAQRKANLFFRGELVHQKIIAYVCDPENGKHVRLENQGWRLPFFSETTAMFSDYVSPNDPQDPGPAGATIRGQQVPVFFYRDEFENWFVKTFGKRPEHRLGRPPGSGSYAASDQPLIEEMNRLLDTQKAKSVWDAARKVAPNAQGASEGSTIFRLARLHKRQTTRGVLVTKE